MAADAAPRLRMTASEYLVWEREQPERHHFVRGEVWSMAGGSPRHNALGLAVGAELRAAMGGGPCRVFSSDQRIVAAREEHYVYPDVSVVCGPVELAPGTKDVLANPSVVVEVLSKRTEAYDRGLKWEDYQRIGSLSDYLLVSQAAPRIEHFQREPNGEWHYRIATAGGRVTLASGAALEVDRVFAGVMELDGE